MRKTVLITGASRGIGKACALEFAKHNYNVVINYVSNDLKAEELKSFIVENYDVDVSLFKCDVSDEKKVKEMVNNIINYFGKIDVLVNNAGVVYNKKLGMIVRDETERMFRINVIAVIEMIQLVSRLMARNKCGSIVNIASVTAVLGSPGQVAYSATKGAVIALTKSAAKELAPQGIRVNAVAPGIIKTERFEELYEASGDKIDARIQKIALGRLGTPQDVATACSFLASDRSSYISGQILGVDGCAAI